MGTRASDTLKEIESIRSGLDAKLVELENRLPALRMGRKTVAMAVGGGSGALILGFAAKRIRGKRKAKKAPDAALVPSSIVVNVVPKGAVPIAVGAVAVWAGVRVFETLSRSGRLEREPSRPAVVTPLPERGSASS